MLVLLSLYSLEIYAEKNPAKGEFFKSEFVQHLRRALNRADLLSRAYDREFQSSILDSTLRSNERCINAMDDLAPVDFKPEPSSVDLSNCSLESPPKADESLPKCSTPCISSNSSTLSIFMNRTKLGKSGVSRLSFNFLKLLFFFSYSICIGLSG